MKRRPGRKRQNRRPKSSGFREEPQVSKSPAGARAYKTHKEGCGRIERVLELLESLPLYNRPRLSRPDSRPRCEVGDDNHGQLHKPNRAHRPRESDLGKQLANHCREDQPSRRASAGRNAKGQRAVPMKVRRQHGERGTEQASVRYTDTDALRQDELPILRALCRRKDPDSQEHGSHHEDGAEVARVCQSAGECTDKEEQEDVE